MEDDNFAMRGNCPWAKLFMAKISGEATNETEDFLGTYYYVLRPGR